MIKVDIVNDRLGIKPGFLRFFRLSPGKPDRLPPMTYRTAGKRLTPTGEAG